MITIDKLSRKPIYEQLIDQFEFGIISGEIRKEDQLPSVRQLSHQLGINPNTLQRAYAELEKRGLCYSVAGSGRYLTDAAIEQLTGDNRDILEEFKHIAIRMKSFGIPETRLISVLNAVYQQNMEVVTE